MLKKFKYIDYDSYKELSKDEMIKLFSKYSITNKQDAIAFLIGYNTLVTNKDYDLITEIFS